MPPKISNTVNNLCALFKIRKKAGVKRKWRILIIDGSYATSEFFDNFRPFVLVHVIISGYLYWVLFTPALAPVPVVRGQSADIDDGASDLFASYNFLICGLSTKDDSLPVGTCLMTAFIDPGPPRANYFALNKQTFSQMDKMRRIGYEIHLIIYASAITFGQSSPYKSTQ